MKRIAVLGTGLVGGLIARDLARDPGLGVVAVDGSAGSLSKLAGIPRVETRVADLANPEEIRAVVREVDAVALAVPGFLGRRALQAILEVPRPVADISFSPEDPLDLDGLARSAGVAAVVDCGVAPGLSNLFAGRSAADLPARRFERPGATPQSTMAATPALRARPSRSRGSSGENEISATGRGTSRIA